MHSACRNRSLPRCWHASFIATRLHGFGCSGGRSICFWICLDELSCVVVVVVGTPTHFSTTVRRLQCALWGSCGGLHDDQLCLSPFRLERVCRRGPFGKEKTAEVAVVARQGVGKLLLMSSHSTGAVIRVFSRNDVCDRSAERDGRGWNYRRWMALQAVLLLLLYLSFLLEDGDEMP